MISVYIASPYRLGDVALNVRAQINIADELMNIGFMPYTPLLTHFQHMVHPRTERQWLDFDLLWLDKCDCLLRQGGESAGADAEIERMNELNRPVFHTVNDLVMYYKTQF